MTEFDQFWAAYPKKKAKADARKAWEQTKEFRPPIDKLIAIIKAHSKTKDWMKSDGEFIPYPATFLRGERWEDELEVKIEGVVNEKPWHETATGIEAKGKEYGLEPSQFQSWPHFRMAVLTKAAA